MNIIVIDDDRAFLRSAEILLARRGNRVTTFSDTAAACLFFEQYVAVDVLILDYVLDELTGVEFLRFIRSHLPPSCKVILISGHTDRVEGLDLDEMGIVGFLPKPLDLESLCDLMDSSLAVGKDVK